MTYFITTDATSDFPKHFFEEDFSIIPMQYILKGIEYSNGMTNDQTFEEFYTTLREGAMPTTTLINEFNASEFFTNIAKQGKDIIHLSFSSGLSGSFANVTKAAADVSKATGVKITVIDSFAASLGEGMFTYYALEKRREGASYDELVAYCSDLRHHICHYFTVDDLNHLYRGGRVSKAKAVIGSALNLKPILYVNQKGHLIPIDKVISRKKSLTRLVEKMEEKMYDASEQKVIFIGHGDCKEDAEFLAKKVTEKFGITNIHIDFIGSVIGSHSGAGTIALFFLGKNKIEEKDKEATE